MESAFWVLLHVALRYLKHDYDPHPLFLLLQQLFDTRAVKKDGSVIGGYNKRAMIMACIYRHTHFMLPAFVVPGLNKALEDFGRVFKSRYLVLAKPDLDEPESEEPDLERVKLQEPKLQEPKLAEPDLKCIPELLRHMALTMKPLSVTPTGLVLPTNDSEPPADPKECQSAKVGTVKTDIYPMPFSDFKY
jgi:hypothetical protein